MSIKEITDRYGRTFAWDEHDGTGQFQELTDGFLKMEMKDKLHEVKLYEMRNDDIIICAYPKAGTHWLWEIVSMIAKETTDYDRSSKIVAMLETQRSEVLESLTSPRVLNTHVYASCLPKQVLEKKIKILHVMRHPKDIAVSYFCHVRHHNWAFKVSPYETFSEFLPYLTGEYGVYLIVSMFRYWKEMESFTEDNKEQVLELHFEDMKTNLTAVVERVAQFLNKELSKDTIDDIAEKCSFKNLKAADATLKGIPEKCFSHLTVEEIEQHKKHKMPSFFRKGEVGDWKNHFTVAESEQFDRLLEEELKDNKYMQCYF